MPNSFTLFDSAIGRCGIAWSETKIVAIRLPERDDAATIAQLARSAVATRVVRRPSFVSAATSTIIAHLAGEEADLDNVPLDFACLSDFDRNVLTITRRILRGKTRTYGAIAKDLGDPQAARAVGAALGRNPWPIVVPCHRVVAANGKLGGFSAPGGRNMKLRLLEIEKTYSPDAPTTLFDLAPIQG